MCIFHLKIHFGNRTRGKRRKQTVYCVKGEDDREKAKVQIVISHELSYYTGIKDDKLLLLLLLLFRVAPTAHGGSQARDLIRAVAAGLHYSYSNAGSELCLQTTPQLTATPDP